MGEYNPKNPDAFNQVTLPEPKPPELNIVPVADGSVVDTGQFSSPNFRKSRLGWRLDSQGNAEFSGGIFRGDFTIGGTVKTIARASDIQEALDGVFAGGGGKVYLQPGTYVLTSDLTIPSGVALEGVSRDTTIIDGNGLYCVRIEGENPYTTGTISITNGTTTVTGTSTAFTQSMVGQYILLDGYWYEIATVTDADTLDIAETFTGSTVSLEGYAIADPNFSTNITLLTITNAPNGGIICAYASEPKFNDLIITNCGTGLDLDYVYAPYIKVGCLGNGVGINMNYVDAFQVDFCDASDSTVGIGFVLTNSGNATVFDSSFSGNVGDGVNMTGCSNIAFVSISVNSNGGQGAEFVSGNSDIQFTCAEFADNTSDGIKLTASSDRISISTSSIHDNGGYGINIAASTCDNNTIIAPAFSNNTSGNISDSGTGTVIIQESDPKFGGTGADGALAISSGTTTIDLSGARVTTKNYSSISITGTGKLAFSNPHANGSYVLLKSTGDVTVTSSTVPCIDARNIGATGGTAVSGGASVSSDGGAGNQGIGLTIYTGAATAPQHSGGGNTVGSGGAAPAFRFNTSSVALQELGKYPVVHPGGGGSSGDVRNGGSSSSTSGAGGNGGGVLIIECKGAWNFTTTGGISVSGQDGGNAVASGSAGRASGGGGGGGGSCLVLYNSLTSNTGTITSTGGVGGQTDSTATGVTLNGGGGGGGAIEAGDNGTATTADNTKNGGDGGDGFSLVRLNSDFV